MSQQPGTQREQGAQKEKEGAGQQHQQQQSGSQKFGQHGDSPSKQEQQPKRVDTRHGNK
jgi:hypothetical protein